jgi:O-methyltransferase domain
VLGIADALRGGPRAVEDLAAQTGTHAPSLYRLLRALAALDVFEELDGRRFALTPVSEHMRSDAADSLAGWAAFMGRPPYWRAWGDLLHSVRTGENAWRHVHAADVWTYRAQNAEESEVFDRAMSELTRNANRALLDAYSFARFRTVVDVGGGRGVLLAELLARHPDVQGVLFDQPHVVGSAQEVFAERGVGDRVRIVAGSFFDGVPEGGDAYLLKWIIHDWEDEESVAILRVCRRAVPAGGAVILIERVLADEGKQSPEAAFSDLNMLVAPGGRERTAGEFAALFEEAGLRLGRIVPAGAGLSVVEAEPI